VGSKAGLSSYIFGKTAGMGFLDDVVILAASLVCLALILVLFKEFQLISFDGDFASSLGWPVYGVDLLLMSLVAAAVVIGLPNVGVVLIAALLIMPGAAARFWTERLGSLLVLAGVFGFATGLIGTILSAVYEQLPAGPIIVLTGAAIFLVSMLLGHRRGVLSRLIEHLRFQRQWHERQLLRAIYEISEEIPGARAVASDALLARRSWTPRQLDRILAAAAADGLVRRVGSSIRLTEVGRRQAIEVTRGQRLWEAFLTQYPDQAGSMLNLASISVADHVPPATVADLTAKLEVAGRWPQAEGGGR
jgi:manganese/zinc/iron transport system permease protein